MSQFEDLLTKVGAPAGEGREMREPATGAVVGYAPVHTVDDLERAIASAWAAQPAWAALGHAERSAILHRAADRVESVAEGLAELLAREQGKPLNGPGGGARAEVGATIAWIRATADTPLEPQVVRDDEQGYSTLEYRPLGVVAAIGPWNFPMMVGIWQIAPALRMGNAVIVKPSEFTPLSALALVEVMNGVLPPSVLVALSGDREVGARLSEHPTIAKVMFTGSTPTGRAIVESSSRNLARLTLELGGNDAAIVLGDVDPVAVAEGLFWGAFVNTGQTCAAIKRLYVHEDAYEGIVDALAAVAASAPMGPSLDESSMLGPLQNKKQFDIVADLIDDAKAHGRRIVTGGIPATDLGELFYPITLVADMKDGDRLVDEDQFGPALPIIRFTDIDDAVASANRLDVGLGASVWSADLDAAAQVADRLDAGTVWINSHAVPHPAVPFGGVKGSGYGLEHGVEGLKAVAAPRVVNHPPKGQ
ncbi:MULTISPECIES: aldehyde dehydrogenase family protein [Rhodococcus]|uniref:Aldehyde dehydrogenase family protein n=1 Tax=Rhodococcus oxybenzonivorans TaxID=1990687 RepID=A0AAE5A867_9NOCA|nr:MULTISPECIES: aldehyde dehydrogenase family protein [Rhodococcus]MDV7241142.1 aldehyde dehydrogenase family protein [Rhodococcus oxybenzonivorans]MDV7266409.1 aldehyde dehydrogenase family protein [Rhodococcus oxybenzonivorans]MDV7273415.1 aldehyde dehydrogenase family protein [Rhodococcus oxybenzonivorans]MDV7332847.1 aldehyde dehydrogenase family protein [Rhodococcus oxybenzonivorans]MDV7342013.1 aldehyde dehydrogenase family protein [Rhodococcus oxybenzonivorans]